MSQNEKIDGNALRGHLETLILSTLETGEAHGFDILRRLEQMGEGALEMKEGSLYPAIYRLEESGLVSGRWEDDSVARRGPRRRLYVLTARGKKDLARRRDGWRSFVAVLGGIIEAQA